jgi:hypothetical protein
LVSYKFFDDETNRIIAKYITKSSKYLKDINQNKPQQPHQHSSPQQLIKENKDLI